MSAGLSWQGAATSFAPTAVGAPLLVACLLAALGRVLPRLAVDIVATGTTAGVVAVDAALLIATRHGRVVSWFGGWLPSRGTSVGIPFVADPLGAGLALLVSCLVLGTFVYSWHYFESVEAHFHVLVLLFLAGMTGFTLSGDVFDMFVFFELMGAVAYALTGFKIEDRTSLHGALNFGIVNSLGAYLTLCGVGILYARYGALGLPQLAAAIHGARPDALVVAGFCLVCTGFLVKAAMVPFHFWLADAHAVAPTPICLLFSGVMVELGVYGVFRVYSTVFAGVLPEDAVRRAFLVLGVLTAVVGAVMCLMQRHLKRLLAYSTIAHVGLFLCAAATLEPDGTTGTAVYVLGHAGAKGALFLLAGAVLNRYGSVDEISLHGRGRDARLMPWLWLVGALALAALPPFGTGLGKSVGEEALSTAGYGFGPVLFVAISAVTGGAALRAGARIYRGLGPKPRDDSRGETTGDEEEPETADMPKVRITMVLPVVVLLAGCLTLGVVPALGRAVSSAAAEFLDGPGYVSAALHGTVTTAPPALPEAGWTTSGVLLGVLSAVLAVAVAAAGLWAPRIPALVRSALRPAAPVLTALRRVHSGHVGDYVAWLFLGVAGFTALVGLPLIGG